MPNSDQNRRFFSPCDLAIWRMTLKNNRAPLLCNFKLCAPLHNHWWIQTGVTVWKRSIWVKIDDFFSHVTLQLDVWPWKTIRHLCYATSSFVHHFVAISEFKLESPSGNAQFGSKSTIFWALWTWNLTDDIGHANLRDLIAATGLVILLKLDSNRRFFSPCDPEIWWMTPKNNRAPLLCNFKLCASFHRVRKCLIWVKIDDFFSRVTLKFDGWPWKTIGYLFYSTSSFMHHFGAIGVLKLELESGNTQFGSNSMIFRAVWPWNLMDYLEKQ